MGPNFEMHVGNSHTTLMGQSTVLLGMDSASSIEQCIAGQSTAQTGGFTFTMDTKTAEKVANFGPSRRYRDVQRHSSHGEGRLQ